MACESEIFASVCSLSSGIRAKHASCTALSPFRGPLARDYLQTMTTLPLLSPTTHAPRPFMTQPPATRLVPCMRPGPRNLTPRMPSGARSQFRTQARPDLWGVGSPPGTRGRSRTARLQVLSRTAGRTVMT